MKNITSRFVSSQTQCCVAWQTVTVVSEAASSSKMSVTIRSQKWHHILQDMYLHQYRCENIKFWNITFESCLWITNINTGTINRI